MLWIHKDRCVFILSLSFSLNIITKYTYKIYANKYLEKSAKNITKRFVRGFILVVHKRKPFLLH